MPETSIYLTIAIIATGVGAVVFLLALLGIGDHDLDIHTDGMDGADGDGPSLLSLKSVIGFFLGVGWGGVFAQNMGWDTSTTLLTSLITGFLMFGITALLIKIIMSLKSDGTLNYNSLVGMAGTVYLTIPPNRERGGQVSIAHPSQLLYLPAIQEGDTPLKAGTPVTVESISANILTVKSAL